MASTRGRKIGNDILIGITKKVCLDFSLPRNRLTYIPSVSRSCYNAVGLYHDGDKLDHNLIVVKTIGVNEKTTYFVKKDWSSSRRGSRAIARDSPNIQYCYTASVTIAAGIFLDMSVVTGSNKLLFKDGFVFSPVARCCKGVVVIDRNPLYGLILSELRIYINMHASLDTVQNLAKKMMVPADEVPAGYRSTTSWSPATLSS
ncbi:hypothetical protein CC86DRAFT_411724 [Ophiobolus disseminans]|uniref:Uncharacterized protein n=1 Tax=Ophiobolus disseminans TaxID=1469910 RepID=A0A6A6ZJN3_9PLEO|nr:hypothetical protein CC86DRAFT_411724 [Ophiobolus disseminans]